MIKAMKKLKLWSRKKRKKKNHHHTLPYYPTPPPTRPPPPPPPPLPSTHHCWCSCSRAVPSAPPLPSSWFDSVEADITLAASASESENSALFDESSSSYQQYTVPNPVYGIPVSVQTAKRERTGGFFGCVVNFGMHLFRCFLPCYRIREVDRT